MAMVVLFFLSLYIGVLAAILILFIFGSLLLLLLAGMRGMEIFYLQKQARGLFKRVQSAYTDQTFTSWIDWPVKAQTRKAIEAAKKTNPGQEMVIGRIDNDGRVLGLFGELPGLKNTSEADFEKKRQYLLEIVLINDQVLVRKDFCNNRFSFVREWYNLITLYGQANVPAVYKVDENRFWLYKNLIPGRTIRDILVDADAKILTVQTKNDPELMELNKASRIEAVWGRGRRYIKSSFSNKFMSELEDQLDKIHACGVTGVSLTFGNIIVDSKNSIPWFIDFDRARVHRSTSGLIFAYRRDQDRVKFNKIYGRDLMTEQSAREALVKHVHDEPGWYAPVEFGGGLTIGGFWSTDSGIGRWKFLNKDVVAPLVVGKRVLDLGCNDGVMSMMMLRSGAREVIGVEISPVFTERAKFVHKIFEWRDMKKYSFHTYNCNMLKILEADWGRFDLVTAFASLYYLQAEDMAKVVRKVSELVPVMILQAKTDTRAEAAEDKARKSSVAFLKELLEDNGFPKVETFGPPNYNRPLLVGRRDS